jgi:hypothetical protein
VAGGPVARFITASTSIRGSVASDDKPTAIGSAKVTKRSHRSWRHGARASTKRLRVTATSTSARGLGSWALDDPQSGVGRRGESLRRRGCAGVAAGSRLGSRERPRDPFVLVDGASDLRCLHDVCTAHGSPT